MRATFESTLRFGCAGDTLQGIVTAPADPAQAQPVGVVVVVGGPQYRAGSHRQFVLLARALGAAGFPVLRYDVRGMGDSSGAQRSFEALGDDIGAAIDALQVARPEIRRVVLWGLCDGASAALIYLDDCRDPRVHGVCMLNPWVRSAAGLARAQVKHYYLQRLLQPAFWRKLLSGGVGLQAVSELAGSLRLMLSGKPTTGMAAPASAAPAFGNAPSRQLPFQDRMARACRRFAGPLLLLLSERDMTAQEFSELASSDKEWRRALARGNVTRVSLRDADHTLSDRPARLALEAACIHWLRALAAADAPAA